MAGYSKLRSKVVAEAYLILYRFPLQGYIATMTPATVPKEHQLI